MYANDQQGKFPPDFESMIKAGYIGSSRVLVAPSSTDRVRPDYPQDMRNATLEQLKLEPENCSYVLVTGIDRDAPNPDKTILVYEKKPFARGGRHVGFVDGHVQFISEEGFRKLLAEQGK